MVKSLPAVQEAWVQSLGQKDLLEKEMAPHSSTLAWKILWTEEPGGLLSMGSQSQTQLSDFTFTLYIKFFLDFSPYKLLQHTEYNSLIYTVVVGYLFYICERAKLLQKCLTLCDPMNCSPPGYSVHGVFQAGMLEWVAISFSRRSFQTRGRSWASHIAGRLFTI